VSIGAVESATASAYMSAINAITDETGVTATSLTEYTFAVAATAGSLQLDISAAANSTDGTEDFAINGVEVDYTANASVETIVTAINTAVNDMGIFAETNEDGEVRLYSTSGLTIDVAGANWNSGSTATTEAVGKLTLSSANGGTISVSSLADTDAERATTVAKAGFTYSNEYSADGSGLNIGSAAAASSALKTLDDSITLLSNNRAEMGAYLKRFEAETSNLQVAVEKTAAALSAIKDADYAVESANLAKAQVLQQAGTAMLAQANASTQNVLSLLK